MMSIRSLNSKWNCHYWTFLSKINYVIIHTKKIILISTDNMASLTFQNHCYVFRSYLTNHLSVQCKIWNELQNIGYIQNTQNKKAPDFSEAFG